MLVPEGLNATEFVSQLRSTVLPELIAAGCNLTNIADTNFVLRLSASETRTTAATLDYGDIQMLRAMLYGFEYFGYTVHSWNCDVALSAIRSMYTNDELSIAHVLADYPALLTFDSTNELSAALAAFTNGVDAYVKASDFIRHRQDTNTYLFNIESSSTNLEEKFRMTLVDLKNSLNGVVPLSMDNRYSVFLAPHFDGRHDMRSMLPKITTQGFVLGTLPDPMFDGIVLGASTAAVERTFAKFMTPVPVLLAPTEAPNGTFRFPVNGFKNCGYVVQASTNLITWKDLGAFYCTGVPYEWTGGATRNFCFFRVVDRTSSMPPPVNDTFETSTPITGWGVTTNGYNANQLTPNGWIETTTSWWRWTAPHSGNVVASSAGSPNWADVNVYTDSTSSNLQWVAGGDGNFPVVAGVTYYISVDSAPGPFTLSLTSRPTLTVDSPLGDIYALGSTNVFISAHASDPDRSIAKLEFFGDGASLGSTITSSLSLTWSIDLGNHWLFIVATDNLGNSTEAYYSIQVY